MKYSFIIIFVLLVVSSSCERKAKSNDSTEIESTDSIDENYSNHFHDTVIPVDEDVIVVNQNFEPSNIGMHLYNFAPTKDKMFCNSDSIVGTDCGFGFFYFTEKGNVVYTFYCIGQDSTSYSIGKYSISTDSSVTCVFNKKYSFHETGFEDIVADSSPVDPNSGKLRSIESFAIKLKKLDCEKFDYMMRIGIYNYVLKKSGEEKNKDFFKDYKKIKAFDNM